MNKKALLALLLAMTLLMSSCSLVVKHNDVDVNRAVITMNGKVMFTKGQVAQQVDAYLDQLVSYYGQYGYSVDKKDPSTVAAAQEEVVEMLQKQAVKAAKSEELGVALTDDEKAAVGEEFDGYYEMLCSILGTPTDLSADQFVAQYFGVTKSTLEANAMETKLKDAVTADVTVTDEDLQAALDEKVEADRANFDADPDAYGTAVNGGTAVYYAPAGYRMVRNLLIQFEQEDLDKVNALREAMATATDLDDGAAQAELDAAIAAGLANIQEKTDAVMARLAAGEDFVTVMNEVTDDPGMKSNPNGYAVREGFGSFDKAFVDAAMGLANVGDYSQPTAGIYGYYIVQYASEVAEGPVALDAVRDQLADSTLTAKKDQAYSDLVDQWVKDAQWVINTKPLND